MKNLTFPRALNYVEEATLNKLKERRKKELRLHWKPASEKPIDQGYTSGEAERQSPNVVERYEKLLLQAQNLQVLAKTIIADLAEKTPIPDSNHTIWITDSEHSKFTWASQGFGAEKYAQASAEAAADNYRIHNIPVKITQDPNGFTVTANCTAITKKILKYRKTGVTLVDWVQNCWKRGVNPRVYNPYLPQGFEEQHGLDFFGNKK